MTEPIGNFGIGITADNKTEKGAREAEKRLAKIPQRVSEIGRRSAIETERSALRSSKSIVSSMGRVEQAAARALGSRSITAGLGARLGAVGDAASAMGSGMAEAAAEGGVLAGSLGAVGAVAGAAAATVGALAYAWYKLGSGWVDDAQKIGRLASVIGVGTSALQEFTAAAERVGVDKATAAGTMGSLSQTLNDARYGRNVQALEVLRRLGVGMVMNADGTVNVEAMLPKIADAIARQNSSGRRTAARALGIPEAALPAFSQGGKALAGDMKDAGRYAPKVSDPEIADAERIYRKQKIGSQMRERVGQRTEVAMRGGAEWELDKANALQRGVNDFARDKLPRASEIIGHAGRDIKDAATKIERAVSDFIKDPGKTVGDLANRIEHLGERSRQNQVSPKGAAGVMQLMPGTARAVAHRLGIPFDEYRYRHDENYNRMLGRAEVDRLQRKYGNDDVLASAAYNAGDGAVDRWIKRFGDPRKGQISDAEFARLIPYKETRDYVHRVVVEFKNAPAGTRATVHSRKGGISYAMQH